jgi:hypothetical protein
MANDKTQGEGDYEAARHYREKTEDFVDKGKVEQQAEDRRAVDSAEKEELERAEQAGKSRAKEKDPSVHRDYKKSE